MPIERREHTKKSSTLTGITGALGMCAAAAITLAPGSAAAQDAPPPPPPGYGEPPPSYYVPQSVAMSGPRKITDWQEGEPIPAGYHPVTRMRTGLVVGGAVTFGVMYLFFGVLPGAIGMDAHHGEYGAFFAPIVGPFIMMPQTGSASLNVLLALDGIAQAAGAAMLIAGIAAPKTILIRNDLGLTVKPTPMSFGKNSGGFGFVGTF